MMIDLKTKNATPVRVQPVVRSLCDCVNWARSVDLKYLTNHHPRCTHYNDSLMDVWKVSDGSSAFYCETEKEASETKQLDEESGVTGLVVTKEKMHREVFEHLPEFEGF